MKEIEIDCDLKVEFIPVEEMSQNEMLMILDDIINELYDRHIHLNPQQSYYIKLMCNWIRSCKCERSKEEMSEGLLNESK